MLIGVTQHTSILEACNTAECVGELLVISLETPVHLSCSPYVEGISLTHGPTGARQHIWTFAAGYSDSDTRWPDHLCPCSTASTTENVMVPPFVGNDYFCECGLNAPWGAYIFYADDPLWDGQNCGTYGTVCCELNNPPWFIKTLPSSTSDNIELRLCYENSGTGSDVPLELIELYVQ